MPPSEPRPATIFVSYSHADERWKNEVVLHLKVLQQFGKWEVWDDSQIRAGDDWYRRLERSIDDAQVAVLLISANYLISDFVTREEVPRLLQRRAETGLRLFPLIVRPCMWETAEWLAKMQVRPKGGRALASMMEAEAQNAIVEFARELFESTRGSTKDPTGGPPPSPQKSITVSDPAVIATVAELYIEAQRLHRDGKWDEVLGQMARIHHLDPSFPDKADLESSARGNARRDDVKARTEHTYARAVALQSEGRWHEALEALHELPHGFRDRVDRVRAIRKMLPLSRFKLLLQLGGWLMVSAVAGYVASILTNILLTVLALNLPEGPIGGWVGGWTLSGLPQQGALIVGGLLCFWRGFRRFRKTGRWFPPRERADRRIA